LLSRKDDVKINATYSTGVVSEFNGGELQLAYAISNHTAIMTNGFVAGKSEIVYDWGPFAGPEKREKVKGSYLETASGYFKNIPGNCMIEIYGGAGIGSSTNDFGDLSGTEMISKINFSKIFMQLAIGYKPGLQNLPLRKE
jgi:hypothetical protein